MNNTVYWEDYIGQDTEGFASIGIMEGPDILESEEITDVMEQVKMFRLRYGKTAKVVLMR